MYVERDVDCIVANVNFVIMSVLFNNFNELFSKFSKLFSVVYPPWVKSPYMEYKVEARRHPNISTVSLHAL